MQCNQTVPQSRLRRSLNPGTKKTDKQNVLRLAMTCDPFLNPKF